MTERAVFRVEDTEPKLGIISLRDGTEIPAGQSKYMANFILSVLVWLRFIDSTDRASLRASIDSSGLPAYLGIADQQRMLQLAEMMQYAEP